MKVRNPIPLRNRHLHPCASPIRPQRPSLVMRTSHGSTAGIPPHLQPENWRHPIPFGVTSPLEDLGGTVPAARSQKICEPFLRLWPGPRITDLSLPHIASNYRPLCYAVMAKAAGLESALTQMRRLHAKDQKEFWASYFPLARIRQQFHRALTEIFAPLIWQREISLTAPQGKIKDAPYPTAFAERLRGLAPLEMHLLRLHLIVAALEWTFSQEESTIAEQAFSISVVQALGSSREIPHLVNTLLRKGIYPRKELPNCAQIAISPEQKQAFPTVLSSYAKYALGITVDSNFPDELGTLLQMGADLLTLPLHQASLIYSLSKGFLEGKSPHGKILLFGQVLTVQDASRMIKALEDLCGVKALHCTENAKESFVMLGDIEGPQERQALGFVRPTDLGTDAAGVRHFSKFFLVRHQHDRLAIPTKGFQHRDHGGEIAGFLLDPDHAVAKLKGNECLFPFVCTLTEAEQRETYIQQQEALFRAWRRCAGKLPTVVEDHQEIHFLWMPFLSPFLGDLGLLERIVRLAKSEEGKEREQAAQEYLFFLNLNPYAVMAQYPLCMEEGKYRVDPKRLEEFAQIIHRFFSILQTPGVFPPQNPPDEDQMLAPPRFSLGVIPDPLAKFLLSPYFASRTYLPLLEQAAAEVLCTREDRWDFLVPNLYRLKPQAVLPDYEKNLDLLCAIRPTHTPEEVPSNSSVFDLHAYSLARACLLGGLLVEEEGHLLPTASAIEQTARKTGLTFTQTILGKHPSNGYARSENIGYLWTADPLHRVVPASALYDQSFHRAFAILKPDDQGIALSPYVTLRLKAPIDRADRVVLACDATSCYLFPLSLAQNSRRALTERDCFIEPLPLAIWRGDTRPTKRFDSESAHLEFPNSTGHLIVDVESKPGSLVYENLNLVRIRIEIFNRTRKESPRQVFDLRIRDTRDNVPRVVREGRVIFIENRSHTLRGELKDGCRMLNEMVASILAVMPVLATGVAGRKELLRAIDYTFQQDEKPVQVVLSLFELVDFQGDMELLREKSRLEEEARRQAIEKSIVEEMLRQEGSLRQEIQDMTKGRDFKPTERDQLRRGSLRKSDLIVAIRRAMAGRPSVAYTASHERIAQPPHTLLDKDHKPRKGLAVTIGSLSKLQFFGRVLLIGGENEGQINLQEQVLAIYFNGAMRYFDPETGDLLPYERVTKTTVVQRTEESYGATLAPYLALKHLEPTEIDKRLGFFEAQLRSDGYLAKFLKAKFGILVREKSDLKDTSLRALIAYEHPEWLPEIGSLYNGNSMVPAKKTQAGEHFIRLMEALLDLHEGALSADTLSPYLVGVMIPYLTAEYTRALRRKCRTTEWWYAAALRDLADLFKDIQDLFENHVKGKNIFVPTKFLARHGWLKEEDLPLLLHFYGNLLTAFQLQPGDFPVVQRRVVLTTPLIEAVLPHERETRKANDAGEDPQMLFSRATTVLHPWGDTVVRSLLGHFRADFRYADEDPDPYVQQSGRSLVQSIARHLDLLQGAAQPESPILRVKVVMRKLLRRMLGEAHYLYQLKTNETDLATYVELHLRGRQIRDLDGITRPPKLRLNVFYVPRTLDFWKNRRSTRKEDLSFRFEFDELKGFHFNLEGLIQTHDAGVRRINLVHLLPEMTFESFRSGSEDFRTRWLTPLQERFLTV